MMTIITQNPAFTSGRFFVSSINGCHEGILSGDGEFLSIRFLGESQQDTREENVGDGDCVMRICRDCPGQIDLARGQNRMNYAKKGKNGTGKCT